jgi:RHS repeat-associated protein
VRQRYRYDGANVRVVKATLDPGTGDERDALYVYPGDYEIRGLERDAAAYAAPIGNHVETQYIVAGARIVWRNVMGEDLDEARNRRVVVPLTSLIQTTTATLDLLTGALVEVATYYPSGGRETLRTEEDPSAAEPMGFTGKEADEEVGLVYFGERYLMPAIGRWAAPDPLSIVAAGGGEALNAYHYVRGTLLHARDPTGLDLTCTGHCTAADPGTPGDSAFEIYDDGYLVMRGENVFDENGVLAAVKYEFSAMINSHIPPPTRSREVVVYNRYRPPPQPPSTLQRVGRALRAISEEGGHIIASGGGEPYAFAEGVAALPGAIRSARGIAAAAWQWVVGSGDDAARGASAVADDVARGATGAPTTGSAVGAAPRTGSRAPFEIRDPGGAILIAEMRQSGLIELGVSAPAATPVRGSSLFERMMAHFGFEARGILSTAIDDNLRTINELTGQGMSLDRAINHTWTARMAAEYGFMRVRLIAFSGTPGAYTGVRVAYY